MYSRYNQSNKKGAYASQYIKTVYFIIIKNMEVLNAR